MLHQVMMEAWFIFSFIFSAAMSDICYLLDFGFIVLHLLAMGVRSLYGGEANEAMVRPALLGWVAELQAALVTRTAAAHTRYRRAYCARCGGRSLCRRGRTPSPRVLRADDFNLVLRSRRWAALTASAYCCSHRFMPSKTPFSQAAALAAARSIARRTARPAARAAAHAAARAAARAAHFHPSPKHAVMPGLLLAKMIKFRLIA